VEIDDYRFTARLESRSDAIRRLMQMALEGELPAEHRAVLDRMRAEQSNRSDETRRAMMEKYQTESERVHLVLSPTMLSSLDAYRAAAKLGS
jgi:Arc/MetJ-type ribon-helix-helix transcriptional regulator